MITSWFSSIVLSHTDRKINHPRTSRRNFPVKRPFSGAKVLDCAKISFTVADMRSLPVNDTADAMRHKTPGKLREGADGTRKP